MSTVKKPFDYTAYCLYSLFDFMQVEYSIRRAKQCDFDLLVDNLTQSNWALFFDTSHEERGFWVLIHPSKIEQYKSHNLLNMSYDIDKDYIYIKYSLHNFMLNYHKE